MKSIYNPGVSKRLKLTGRQVGSPGLMLGLVFVYIGCSLHTPGAPSWTVEVTAPFNQRTYRLSELISDSSKFAERRWGIVHSHNDSTLRFEYNDSLEYQTIGDRITYDPTNPKKYTNDIEHLQIEAPDTIRVVVPITGILGDTIAGYRGVIPPFQLLLTADAPEFNIFHWARVRAGVLNIRLINDLPVRLDSLKLTFSNSSDQTEVTRTAFSDAIRSGTAIDTVVTLEHRFLTNKLLIAIQGSSPGRATTVRVRGDESLTMVLSLTPMVVDSTEAELGVQRFSKDDALETTNRNKVIEATIKRGYAYLMASNTLPALVTTTSTYLNITDSVGSHPVDNRILQPGSIDDPWSVPDSLDLTGYTIQMTLDNQAVLLNTDSYSEDTRLTIYQGRSYQAMFGYQGVKVRYWTGELVFSSFTGILDSVEMDIPPSDTQLDLPEGLDNVQFTEDTLAITMINETPYKMNGFFDITGMNTRDPPGRTVVLPVASVLMPGYNLILVPEADRLTSILPDLIRITGVSQIGSYFFPETADQVLSVTDEAGFYGDFSLGADLKFTMGAMMVESDPMLLSNTLDYPVEEVALDVHMINSIPLNGTIFFMAGTDTNAMDTLLAAPTPRVTPVSHRTSAADTSFSAVIIQSKFDLMRQPGVYIQQILSLEGSGGDTLWLYPEDSLVVKAQARIRYTLDLNSKGN